MPRTLANKVWDQHVVSHLADRIDLLYVDLHLIHEVTTPQAFAGLEMAARSVRRPDLTLGTMDHSVPTANRSLGVDDAIARKQLDRLEDNCRRYGIKLFDLMSRQQGIVHMIGPEVGATQPGLTIVCGDSHTSTHGAFGALAFGIGTSEVEHVLATQTLPQSRPKTLAIEVTGHLASGVTAKDLILGIINQIGVEGGIGSVIEYRGEAIRALSMEQRMTVCNMSIEAGARAGMIAPDDTTFAYLESRPYAPRGAAWERSLEKWRGLRTDDDAEFDRTEIVDASRIEPTVTWGTTPAMSVPVTGHVPEAADAKDPDQADRALQYMGLRGGERIEDLKIDRVFIGSCTNSRIEDLRAAARVVDGKVVDPSVRAMVVPGSYPVKSQAEYEGLDDIFTAAGFEWREPGCSMCIGMNDDVLEPGERCASTSNRNFEGRQGRGGRTHLMSPEMAAAAALYGQCVDIRQVF